LGIFWSTLNGQVLSGNRALLKYLRFDTEEELLEWHAKSFYVDPEQYEHLKALAVEQGLLANYPVALRRADGTTMDALLTVDLVREPGWEEPLVAGMVQDITGQREAEEALRTAREGSPLFYNQAYAQVMKLLLGIEMKPGLKPHELLPDPEGRALWEDYHRRVLDGERFTVEYARRVDNDRTVYLEVAYNPVYVDGEIIGFSEFSRDISQQKQAEIEYQELHDRIQNAQRLESLGVLAGGVAHDFNNLLTPVLSLADLCIQEAPPDSELNARLLAIRQAARRATALANQMLVYAGHSHAELVSVDFAQVIRDMESLLHTTATKRVGIEYQMSDL
jgi:PAS domain S-box-containing protein